MFVRLSRNTLNGSFCFRTTDGKLQSAMRVTQQPTSGISVVIPVFNEQATVEPLYRRLRQTLEHLGRPFEIIFVDDGSRDRTQRVLSQLACSDPGLKLVRFRRNFGKSAALAAGFRAARLDIIITMDGDLQDLPEELPKLIDRLGEDYDVVSGWRHRRRDPWSKRAASFVYNRTTSWITGVRLHDFNCGFKGYRRAVLDEVRIYGERHRFIPVLASYRGFKIGEVKVEHAPRQFGRTKYGWERFLGGFFSLLTVILLTRYTNRPLHFFGIVGLLFSLAGLIIDSYLAFERLFFRKWLGDRPLLLFGTFLIIIGIQFIFFGLLGEMIASTFRREDDYSIIECSPTQTADQPAFSSEDVETEAARTLADRPGR